VQWVPHGYGWWSLNVPLAVWLACRAWLRGDELHVMVHEPFLQLSPRPLALARALVQRFMIAAACSGATRIWLSIPGWSAEMRGFVPRRIPQAWLPVPAPSMSGPSDQSLPNHLPAESASLVVGHFGTFSPLVAPLLAQAFDVLLDRTTTQILLVGRGGERFLTRFLAGRPEAVGRVHATGVLHGSSLQQAIERCDAMVQPYPDGISARRTSALAVLARGGVVVTNSGRLTESFWNERGAVVLASGPDGRLVGEAALEIVEDADRRSRLSQLARELYDQVFDIRHGVALLEAARGNACVRTPPLNPMPREALDADRTP
jgi:glycosyltransferase involved in cell wall biosynthesis